MAELNKEIVEEITPTTDIDSSAFEWVGRDLEKSEEIRRPSISFWQDAFGRLKRDKSAIVFVTILVIISLCAILIPIFCPYGYSEQHTWHVNADPFFSDGTCFHIFGTDYLGRDTFVRIWEGGRNDRYLIDDNHETRYDNDYYRNGFGRMGWNGKTCSW